MHTLNSLINRMSVLSSSIGNLKAEFDDIHTQLSILQATQAVAETLPVPQVTEIAEPEPEPGRGETSSVVHLDESAYQPTTQIDERAMFIALMIRFLSPSVMEMAQGIIAPGSIDVSQPSGKLSTYRDDVTKVDFEKLRKWPCGFYRNHETQALQFFYKAEKHWVIADFSGRTDNGAAFSVLNIFSIHEDGTLFCWPLESVPETELPAANKELYEALQKVANQNLAS